MAESFISNEDLFGKDLTDKAIKDIQNLISELDKLDDSFIKIGKDAKQAFDKLDISKTKGIEELNLLLEETRKKTKDLEATQVENNKLKIKSEKLEAQLLTLKEKQLKAVEKEEKATKKNTEATEEEIKAKIKSQKANAERNKKIKEQIELEDFLGREIKDTNDLIELGVAISKKELKTKAELKEANKLLARITNQLNIEVKEEKEAIDALNIAIDNNNDKIDENASKFEQSKRNVGNYTESIQEALKSTGLFGEEFDKLKNGIQVAISLFSKKEKQDQKSEKTTTEKTKATKKNSQATAENAKELKKQAKAQKEASEATEDGASKLDKLNDVIKGSVIGLIITALASLGSYFTSGSDGAESFGRAIAYVTGTVKALADTFANFGKLLVAVAVDFKNLDLTFSRSRKEADNFGKAINSIPDRVKASVKATQDLATANKLLGREIALRIPQLAKLQAQEQIYIDLVDDDTLAMTTRNKLIDVSIAKTDEYFNSLVRQATAQKELVEAELLKNLAGKTGFKEALANYKDLQTAFESGDKTILGFLDQNDIDKYANALAEVVTQDQEYIAKKRDNGEKIRKLTRDVFERDLDDIIDYTDKQFVLNERILANDSQNLEARKKSIESLTDVQKESFTEQIRLFEKQRKIELKASIEANKIALGNTKDKKLQSVILQDIAEKQRLLNTTIDENRLLNAKNSKEYNAYVRSLGFGEIAENRLLQATRDRLDAEIAINDANKEGITILKDTVDLQKETTLQNEELLKQSSLKVESLNLEGKTLEEITQIEADLAKQKEASANTEFEYTNKLKQAKIDALRQEIDTRKGQGETDSIDLLNAQKELNDLLLEQQKEYNDKTAEENQKAIDERKKQLEKEAEDKKKQVQEFSETISNFAQAFDEVLQEASQKRLNRLEKQAQASLTRQDALRQQIENGNADATKSLAEEERNQADIEKKKQAEEKRRASEQLVIAGVQAYSNSLKSGKNSKEALTDTVTDVAVLKELLKGLSSFYVGTDDTGKVKNGLDSNGGRLAILHDEEQIWSKKDRSEVNFQTRDEIKKDVAYAKTAKNMNFENLAKIENEMRLTRIAIESLPNKMPLQSYDFDKLSGIIRHSVKKGNSQTTTLKSI